MIKIVLLILLVLGLHADSETTELHKKDSDTAQRYFRGISDWYITDDSKTQTIAQSSATKKAYNLLSEYFGITHSNNHAKIYQHISTIKPLKIYKELDESKEKFRVNTIIYLDKESEDKIREIIQKKQKLDNLKQKVLHSIERKKYFEARDLLELAKKEDSLFTDASIQTIEQRLNTLIDTLLQAKLVINKKNYLPNESIELEVSLNKDGYLYLFYETGLDVEMLFPNEYQRVAYLKKDISIFFPNENIEKVTAYKDDSGKEVIFYAIASKESLSIKGMSEEKVDGKYIYEKTGNYKNLIDTCIDDGMCTKTIVTIKVSDPSQ